MTKPEKLIAVRWTVGDVSAQGFEALNLSIWSAAQLFPLDSLLAVCVNTISVPEAKARTGEVPSRVQWLDANHLMPAWLMNYVDPKMAEGVAWKLAPVRLFPHTYEIAMDNDVVLWAMPDAMQNWLKQPGSCLLAEDTQKSLGQFSHLVNCAINSGIRGLPPNYDYEADLRAALDETQIVLSSELDEQGLQAATLSRHPLHLISTGDVTICSPFSMHQHHLGRCGAHFVGLNVKCTPWTDETGRPMHERIQEAWKQIRGEIETRMGAGQANGPLQSQQMPEWRVP